MEALEQELKAVQEWMCEERFAGITRVHTARQVIEQRGTVATDYIVAREAAEHFYRRLRGLFSRGQSITTFGPYSPGQAVAMKRAGIEGIYLGGWATSAVLASQPCSSDSAAHASRIRARIGRIAPPTE